MKEDYTAWLPGYLDGSLTPEQREALEQALRTDADLREHLALLRAGQALRNRAARRAIAGSPELASLREHLKKIPTSYPPNPVKKGYLFFWVLLAVGLVATLWLVFKSEESAPGPADKTILNDHTETPALPGPSADTNHQSPAEKPEITPPSQKPDSQPAPPTPQAATSPKLPAEKPFWQDDQKLLVYIQQDFPPIGTRAGEQPKSLADQAFEAFDRGQWSLAIERFEALPSDSLRNFPFRLAWLGAAYFQEKNWGKTIGIFEELQLKCPPELNNRVTWYLLLAYLRSKDPKYRDDYNRLYRQVEATAKGQFAERLRLLPPGI